MAPEVIFEVQ